MTSVNKIKALKRRVHFEIVFREPGLVKKGN